MLHRVYYDSDIQKVPVKSYASDLEDGAKQQAINASKLPFIHKHIFLAPDAHQGYGVPIGAVVPTTNDVISPAMVGVDIGCGMRAIKTNLKEITKKTLKKVKEVIPRVVPIGGGSNHKKPQDDSLIPYVDIETNNIIAENYNDIHYQIGTLGGGNHFIEFQRDEDNNIWIMIHTGSRNIGHTVATYYMDKAKELNKKWYSDINSKWKLHFLPVESEYGQKYKNEMKFCQRFAKANRETIMYRVMEAFQNCVEKYDNNNFNYVSDQIDIHHNYATIENHYGKM